MHPRLVRLLFENRRFLKPLLPVRGPILRRLPEFALYVRLDDWAVGARIALKGGYEPHVERTLRGLLRPGDTFLDIGANVGYFSMLAARVVGPTGRVHAFEPAPANCELLRLSRAANGFENLEIHEVAVADRDGVVGYEADDSNGMIHVGRADPAWTTVRCVTLDAHLGPDRRVDVVKLDVEGAEHRALLGMRALIRRWRPAIVSELSPAALRAASGVDPAAYLDLLRDFGYRIRPLYRDRDELRFLTNEQVLARFERPDATDHVDILASRAGAGAGARAGEPR